MKKLSDIKAYLLKSLKKENAFWSYDSSSITVESITDDQLIAYTLRYLDLEEINLLFIIYPVKKIKNAWRKILLPEGDYLRTLNRFVAWYYFDIKDPDSYLKTFQTQHLNKIC